MFEKFTPDRNAPFEIVIPSKFCFAFKDPIYHENWCEMFIPPALISELSQPWGTIIVRPEYVFNTQNSNYYEFLLTADSKIKICYKDDSFDRNIIRCEYEYSEGIIARLLQYEAYINHRVLSGKDDIKFDIYNDYKSSGLTMSAFISSLTK